MMSAFSASVNSGDGAKGVNGETRPRGRGYRPGCDFESESEEVELLGRLDPSAGGARKVAAFRGEP
jgi:hypothetical protein